MRTPATVGLNTPSSSFRVMRSFESRLSRSSRVREVRKRSQRSVESASSVASETICSSNRIIRVWLRCWNSRAK